MAHPAAIFDRLMHLSEHWLQMTPETIRADRETHIRQILDRVDTIPQTFSDSQRVLFTLGYYHQAHALDKPQFADSAIKFLLPGRTKPVLLYPGEGSWAMEAGPGQ